MQILGAADGGAGRTLGTSNSRQVRRHNSLGKQGILQCGSGVAAGGGTRRQCLRPRGTRNRDPSTRNFAAAGSGTRLQGPAPLS